MGKRTWTPEQRQRASERAKARTANPEGTMQQFQKRTSEVAERTEGGAVALLERDDHPYWPSGKPKVYVHGQLIPEGWYHTVVAEWPASYGLGSAFEQIENSGKGYKMLAQIGPGKRIYICEQWRKDERDAKSRTQARSRVIGVVTTKGSGDILSHTERTTSGPAVIDEFLAQSRTHMSAPELLTAAEQSRAAQMEDI